MHNSEINWKTKKIKITRCLPICKRNTVVKKNIEQRKKIGKRIRVVDQGDRNEWKWTIEEKFDDKVELDGEKVKKIVP